MKKKIRVGILFGGKSVEHEISILSAQNIFDALDKKKYDPVLMGIDKQGFWHYTDSFKQFTKGPLVALTHLPQKSGGQLISLKTAKIIASIDVVFPILHGPFGEDGTVQGLLKLNNIPFVGPGILSSAICMDKEITKRLLKEANISIANYVTVTDKNKITYSTISEKLGLPFFIKPANLGSSVGIHKVKSEKEFLPALNDAFLYDSKILIEECIDGREIECAVLGPRDSNDKPLASHVGEVISQHEFYSYEAKYLDEKGAILKIPTQLEGGLLQKVQEIAIKTFQTLECEGMARIDFFLKKNGDVIVNEVNTIPGFTQISMYPKLLILSGIAYPQILETLIELAFQRFHREKKLKTSFKSS